MDRLEYVFFEEGFLNLNIVGVRNSNGRPDRFDDEMHVIFKDETEQETDYVWQHCIYPITTTPGLYWLKNPMFSSGTGIMVPGQYRRAYCIGKHRGAYDALVQIGSVRCYLDKNKDEILDMKPDTIVQGKLGMNIHRASRSHESKKVNRWSAGCQVFSNPQDFKEFMDICFEAKEIWGNRFTYTLMNGKDVYGDLSQY